jgi:hypothetical protein
MKDMQPRHVKAIRNEIRDAFTASAADIAIGIISTLWDFADEQLGLDLPGADPTPSLPAENGQTCFGRLP